ncbi:MAG: hypothetical protein L6R28_20200 [Planctomycetes bacterium]|nr:hypothetical protein [Planctomycetota bacterium]
MSIDHSCRMQELEREIVRLRHELAAKGQADAPELPAQAEPTVQVLSDATDDDDKTLANINLAPGYVGYGWQNSLYTTTLKVMAVLTGLATQDARFRTFAASPDAAQAKELLQSMLIPVDELIAVVKQEDSYREHCRRRTREWRNRAARGNRRARRVVNNSDRFQRGRWVGNFEEVVGTLRVGNTPRRTRYCENVNILARIGCCFDVIEHAGRPHCVLYPARWHAYFIRARQLAVI